MRDRVIFVLAILGVVAGLTAAWLFGIQRKAQPPVFKPVSSPYATAIYANGIVESEQAGGSNIAVYPEVAGRVTQVLVREGQRVTAGTPMVQLDDTVQRASTEQARLQADAAFALLAELKAQPRPEALEVARAQVDLAAANLKSARDQYDKRRASLDIDPHSISRDVLDTADNALRQAAAAQDVARRQYQLTRAGAWRYDIVNQQRQAEALRQTWQAALALLRKFTITASVDGVVLAVNTTPGSYVSPQGAFDAYTQGLDPLALMSAPQDHLAVRCYVDEILVSRLPAPDRIQAQMAIRGTDLKVPLEFVRVQPYVSPKIQLSNQRQERVDLRVLPVLFRFRMTAPAMVYPGQLVDVFIGPKTGQKK